MKNSFWFRLWIFYLPLILGMVLLSSFRNSRINHSLGLNYDNNLSVNTIEGCSNFIIDWPKNSKHVFKELGQSHKNNWLAISLNRLHNKYEVKKDFLKKISEISKPSNENPSAIYFINDGQEFIFDTIKILAIGNSFSDDALEHYLAGLARASGEKVVIGNLYIGGARLSTHWGNAKNDKPAYSYRKIENGKRNVLPNTTIAYALLDEDWNFISFQQASIYSGRYTTFIEPLSNLYNYVKDKIGDSKVEYLLHQTWAYATYSDHVGFDTFYNSNQFEMYHDIVDAYLQAEKLIHADMIIPSGTAIQNGRTSSLGDNFNRDGHHLNVLGRYTASCTWFESIFGKSVMGNTYKPDELTECEVAIAQMAAHYAVESPNEVTPIVDSCDNNEIKDNLILDDISELSD